MNHENKMNQIIVSQEKLIMAFLVMTGGLFNMIAISMAAPHFAGGDSGVILDAFMKIYYPWGLFVMCMGGALMLRTDSRLVIRYPSKPYIGKHAVLFISLASAGCGVMAAFCAEIVFGHTDLLAFIPLAFVMASSVACWWMVGVRLGLASSSDVESQTKKDDVESGLGEKPVDKFGGLF